MLIPLPELLLLTSFFSSILFVIPILTSLAAEHRVVGLPSSSSWRSHELIRIVGVQLLVNYVFFAPAPYRSVWYVLSQTYSSLKLPFLPMRRMSYFLSQDRRRDNYLASENRRRFELLFVSLLNTSERASASFKRLSLPNLGLFYLLRDWWSTLLPIELTQSRQIPISVQYEELSFHLDFITYLHFS